MEGGPGSQPSLAPADPPAPMCIAQWAAQWPQSAPAGRVNCTANRCNRPLAPSGLPALPHDYDHQHWRGVACWDRGHVTPEIFKAFYSPVAACLLECLCVTRYDTWNRWYCGPCGAMVQSSPLDHISTTNHIKKVRNCSRSNVITPALLLRLADPQHLVLGPPFDVVLRFCLVSGVAEYIPPCEAPDDAGDLLRAPGLQSLGQPPPGLSPVLGPQAQRGQFDYIWASQMGIGGLAAPLASNCQWGSATDAALPPPCTSTALPPPRTSSAPAHGDHPAAADSELDLPALADGSSPPLPPGARNTDGSYVPVSAPSAAEDEVQIFEASLIVRHLLEDGKVFWDTEISASTLSPPVREHLPVVTGLNVRGLFEAGGPSRDDMAGRIYICRIGARVRWYLGASVERECTLALTQYQQPGMANRCTPLAIAWCALAADGANPCDESTLMAAFGATVNIPYPEGATPWVELTIRELGVFTNANTSTVDFQPVLGQTVFEGLIAPSHPVAAVCCALGASFGIYARSETVLWTFDSHGSSGSGAQARRWDSIAEMVEEMLQNARTARSGAQLTVFRPGSSGI